MKLLFYGESPLNPTGFGQVNRYLLKAACKVAQVRAVCSTHYHEDYDHDAYPYEMIGCDMVPASDRSPAHQRNLDRIMAAIKESEWDVFFYQGDFGWNNDVLVEVHRMLEQYPERFAIFYLPVDGDISFTGAFDVLKLCNVPVVYTHHARGVIQRYAPEVAKETSVIWLGCETETFYPLSPEERKAARLELFGEYYTDQFLCLNVNRNQVRKDLERCMGAFHLFHQVVPASSLYMHSVMVDVGGSLPLQAQMTGCDVNSRPAEIVFSSLDLAAPWPRETLNKLYNACDCLVSTAHGEGWGLTTTEAMCAGIPVVVPYNTANIDILGENQERGWGVRAGGDLDHTVFIYANGGSPVATIHADSFVSQLQYVYDCPEIAAEKAMLARAWALENTWEKRENEWIQLLQVLKSQLETTSS